MRPRRLVLVVLTCCLLQVPLGHRATPLLAQQRVAREIERLEDFWVAAELRKDTAAVAPLLADNYLNVGNDGKRMDKAGYLHAMTADPTQLLSNVGSDYQVQVVGNTAIIHGLSTQTLKDPKGPKRFRYRWVDIWVRQADGKWRSVGGQNCPVP